MDKSFKLSTDFPLSKRVNALGLETFNDVLQWVKALPYGRNSNRSDYRLLLTQGLGTCSTKHAFLKAIALENNFEDLELILGIFRMNAINTPKIKSILDLHSLPFIPEAHCYLKYKAQIIDITFNGKKERSTFEETLLCEEIILPDDIGDYKINKHRSYLKSWIKTQKLTFNIDQLWSIREACIQKISE
ncbi:MAG: hypothetical protein WA775_10855 [Psychroserpens sp.]|uniref:hypothetical protein n=1 Tax=Psychroserpens sp. TaxID=2020870 RepID=UPI003C74DAE5